MVVLTGGKADVYKEIDHYFQSFRIGKRENSILHALLSLGINQAQYQVVRINKELAPRTGLAENECSKLIKCLRSKMIINTNYCRKKHELSVVLLPRDGWLEAFQKNNKKEDVTETERKEKSGDNKSSTTDDIDYIDDISGAVNRYCRDRDRDAFIRAVDAIILKYKKR